MENKKGFTLVEMLGVLIILVIIFMISFPTLTRVLKNTEEDLANSEKTIVVDATKDLLNSKKDIYIPNDDNTYCIAFETLMNQGKLTENQVENISEDYNTVKVTYKNRKAIYEVLGAGCTEVIKDAHLELVGKANVNLELASDGSVKTYVEEGLNFINNGVVTYLDFTLDNLYPDLSIEVISQKTGNITTYLPETVLDTYVIKYAYMAEDGTTYYAERTVKIGDNEAPVIVVNPGDVTLSITNTTYDVRSGVTVTDNSGITPTLTVSTNLNLGKAGNYVINYTATDRSGNKAVAKRNVTITNGNLINLSIGDKVVYIGMGMTYVDQTVTATGIDGTDYSSLIVRSYRTAEKTLSNINTELPDNQYITYSVTKDGVTYSETRTVIIETIPAPVIAGGNRNWVNTDTTLTIGTPSTSESGIKEYRFYVSTSETSLIGGSWETADSKTVTNEGIYYVFARAVANSGTMSIISEPVRVKIDKTPPVLVDNGEYDTCLSLFGEPDTGTLFDGLTVTDNYDTSLEIIITSQTCVETGVTSAVTDNTIGGSAGNHYNAVFSVTDDAGNTATITRGPYVQSNFMC